ncbi:hypothetical protein ACHHYP_04837 [Achlya hypogyna]|uniref:PDZ domain-containing protein n=1 Tax=Achlya hypogyna TaxID=1202772 RepID=A0A1V9YZM7_ACHHY|nr:hypothetical protein ACHHYP_04837 [Achlya hypogyna]
MDDLVFNVAVEKGDGGFGIYFIANDLGQVIVEGFVPAADGGVGPAELLGCMQPCDVLEKINGRDITQLSTALVVEALRAAPQGLNALTFRRHHDVVLSSTDAPPTPKSTSLLGALKGVLDTKPPPEPKSPQWWTEFHRLKAAELRRWNAAGLSDIEFCDYVYSLGDDQQKSYLRQEYPTLLQHHQDRFSVWPRPVQTCGVVAYESATRAPTHIAPSLCLVELINTLRAARGWTRQETAALVQVLQTHYGVHSAFDLLCCRRRDSMLHMPSTAAFPRVTPAVWRTLDDAARQLVASEDLSFVDTLPFY